MKTTRKQALEQAKKLMAKKANPRKRFRLPQGFFIQTDAVGADGCKVTVSKIVLETMDGPFRNPTPPKPSTM